MQDGERGPGSSGQSTKISNRSPNGSKMMNLMFSTSIFLVCKQIISLTAKIDKKTKNSPFVFCRFHEGAGQDHDGRPEHHQGPRGAPGCRKQMEPVSGGLSSAGKRGDEFGSCQVPRRDT